jgi:hypothetical protein
MARLSWGNVMDIATKAPIRAREPWLAKHLTAAHGGPFLSLIGWM